jgi:hypothetical protein
MEESIVSAAERTGIAPPYVAYKTLINFLDGLRRATPSRIDKSIMQSLSGAVQGQLMAALHFFQLIDVAGRPQDTLMTLVHSEGRDRQRLFREIVDRSYGFIFNSSLDFERVTRKEIEELFGAQGISGETLRKSLGLFLALASDAGIRMSPHVKTVRARATMAHRRRAHSTKGRTLNGTQEGLQGLSWSQLLLSKFPSFDPNWSDRVKTRWFDSFEELMKRSESAK